MDVVSLMPGRYVLVLKVATLATAPWFPTVPGASTSTVLVDLVREGDGWLQTGRVCGVQIDGGAIARIEVPPAFLAAMTPSRVVPSLDGAHFRADLGLDVVGFRRGSLPTSLDETYDWDGDGRPAATIRLHIPAIGDAELYVVQAAHVILDGTVTATGIRGGIEVRRFEQDTLGATPSWLAAKTRMTVDLGRSGFTMAPVAPETTCADLAPRKR